MLFNLDFGSNTIFSFLFFFSLIIGSYFVIVAAVALIFNPVVEFVIPIGIPSKAAKAEIEMYLVIAKTKIIKSSI